MFSRHFLTHVQRNSTSVFLLSKLVAFVPFMLAGVPGPCLVPDGHALLTHTRIPSIISPHIM